jgi:hypothetical protein
MADLRYPIGKFVFDSEPAGHEVRRLIDDIADTPERLRAAVEGLSERQLDTPYRPDGWTVRQVVHHVPDSHVNSYVRFRLALTETEPTIRPYDEARWAELTDARTAPVGMSLALLDSLHERWVVLLRSLSSSDLKLKFIHPEIGEVSLVKNVALYAWHGKHHVAHITSLRERMGWL